MMHRHAAVFLLFLSGRGGGWGWARRREKAVIVALRMYQACNRNLIGRYEALTVVLVRGTREK